MMRRSTELDRAVAAYLAKDGKLVKAEKAMLALLRESNEATAAFAALKLSDVKGVTLVHDCVVAHRIAKGGHEAEVKAHRAAPDPKKARAALAELERFFQGAVATPKLEPKRRPAPPSWEEFQRSPRPYIHADRGPMGDAIAVLAQAIDDEERLRKEHRKAFSRKNSDAAASSRAILWLRKSVSRLSGSPNIDAVRAIAAAVLGRHDSEIDLNHVKNAITPSERLAKKKGTFAATKPTERANT